MLKQILVLLVAFSVTSCVNRQKKDEEQIKSTVHQFWRTIQKNDLEKYQLLFYDNETFFGGIQSDFYFLRKNYNRINPNNKLLMDIKIKDTTIMFVGNKQKYVQYIIEKENDSNNIRKPLVITLMFYKPVGYDKIYNPSILQNHIGWGK